MKSLSVTIQMKVTEQYFPVVLFIMLYKVVLTFEFVDEILKCDHSNESYWAVLSCGAVYHHVQGGSNFWVCDEILKCDHSNESYWAVLSCGAVYTWLKKRYLVKSINHERRDTMEFWEKMSISFFSVPFWCARCLRIKAGSSASQKTIGSYSLWFMLFTWQRFFN